MLNFITTCMYLFNNIIKKFINFFIIYTNNIFYFYINKINIILLINIIFFFYCYNFKILIDFCIIDNFYEKYRFKAIYNFKSIFLKLNFFLNLFIEEKENLISLNFLFKNSN